MASNGSDHPIWNPKTLSCLSGQTGSSGLRGRGEKNHALLSRNFQFFPLVHEIKCPDAQTIELRPSVKLQSFYFFIQALQKIHSIFESSSYFVPELWPIISLVHLDFEVAFTYFSSSRSLESIMVFVGGQNDRANII